MANLIVSNPLPCCHDCGQPLDIQRQADGKGGSYLLVTCWTPGCLLYSITRSLATYATLTSDELEAYREMNRMRVAG